MVAWPISSVAQSKVSNKKIDADRDRRHRYQRDATGLTVSCQGPFCCRDRSTVSSDPKQKPIPPLAGDQASTGVPTFACIVYLEDKVAGGVHGRVANLEGVEADGTSERDVLAKIVPAFKALVSDALAQGDPIPWIEPPAEPGDGERKRFVPVHL